MDKFTIIILSVLLSAANALTVAAAGLDRSGQDVSLIFKEGNVFKATVGYVNPHLSSSGGGPYSLSGVSDAGNSYVPFSFGYKHQLTEQVSLALLYDQPYGADIYYNDGPFSDLLGDYGVHGFNGQAKARTHALTFLGRYEFGNGFSIHGGVRGQKIEEGYVISSPGVLDISSGWEYGGVVGAAYEVPEIALRIALTYSTEISHKMKGTEDSGFVNALFDMPLSDVHFTLVMPESVNLNMQTGITKRTLLFSKIRWVHWGGFSVTSPLSGGDYVAYSHNEYTVTVGLGRKMSENLTLVIPIGYERSKEETVSTLGPKDGYWSLGLGGTYTMDKTTIGLGFRYFKFNDAVTTKGELPFGDNFAVATGMSMTHNF